jgi:hypothetical protein
MSSWTFTPQQGLTPADATLVPQWDEVEGWDDFLTR